MNRANNIKIRIENLTLSFGGNTALSGLNMEIREGGILAIIGPNGAGKTCLLNCINGFYRPQEGEIYFEGRILTRIAVLPFSIPNNCDIDTSGGTVTWLAREN
jgi:ABC-type branched-subunit amino acid transport system ATPase component